MLQERKPCPLCGLDNYQIHISFPKIPVVRCLDCQMMYSRYAIPSEELEAYYRSNFGGARHRQGQEVNARVNTRILRRLLPLERISSALDVGTGYGFLLRELKRMNIEAVGVELSAEEAEFANSTLGQNVINCLLQESNLKEESFDLVSSFEVVEHTEQPLDFLRDLTRYVKPGGYLLVMTDNFEGRTARSLGAGFPKWIPHAHISHFTPKTISAAIESIEGLTIKSLVTYSPWDFIARIVHKKVTGREVSPEAAFDYETVLKSEMTGEYPLFALRRQLNPIWAGLSLRDNARGDLMYVVAQKKLS